MRLEIYRAKAALLRPAPGGNARHHLARLMARAGATLSVPLVSYIAIIAIQMRILWKIWDYKDLMFGDTASYFLTASAWTHGLRDDIIWSPLYTDTFGTIAAAIHNVYAAETVERLAIVLAASLLVLALMRRLFGPSVGLLVALWWVVLPPNFNVEYEVHLFGALPILVAALILARRPSRRALGAALGVLLGASLLLRNELLIATVLVALAVVLHEYRGRHSERVSLREYLRAYAIPLVVVILLTGGAYWRSFDRGSAALASFAAKQDLNLCQVYAFNYQQRHPNLFTGNPFTQCQALMRHDFGRSTLSFLAAFEANPGAMAAMVGWNGLLIPSGVQIGLFGATVTSGDPDYFPVHKDKVYPLVLSVLALVIVVAGLLVARRDPRFWRQEWLRQRRWAILLLAAVGIDALVVALTERPRPEYLYGLTLGLMVLIAAATVALLRHAAWTRIVAPGAAVLTAVLAATVSPFYSAGPRPIRDGVARLQGVRRLLNQPSSVLLTEAPGGEICDYLAAGASKHCTAADLQTVIDQVAARRPVAAALASNKVTVIYADPAMQANADFKPVLAHPGAIGYRVVSSGFGADGRWSVLLRDG